MRRQTSIGHLAIFRSHLNSPRLLEGVNARPPCLTFPSPPSSVPFSASPSARRLGFRNRAHSVHPPVSLLCVSGSAAPVLPMTTAVEKRARAAPDASPDAAPDAAPTAPPAALDPSFPLHEDSESSQGERIEARGMKEGGYHPVQIGDSFKNGAYRVLCRLGTGHFSTVWLCLDTTRRSPRLSQAPGSSSAAGGANHRVVALKIQKSALDYTEAAKDEIKLLEAVRRGDPNARAPVISLLDHFDHYGPNGRHICLVFDVLGSSLLRLVKRFNYKGAPISIVRTLSKCILEGLHYLHEEVGIIHTDLKPENVLFEIPEEMVTEIERQAAIFGDIVQEKRRQAILSGNFVAPGRMNGRYGSGSKYKRNQKKRMKARAKKAGTAAGPKTTSSEHVGASISAGNGEVREGADVLPGGQDEGVSQKGEKGTSSGNSGIVGDRFELSRIVDKDVMFSRGLVKIADLGNACWTDKHFTEDIQTRQYRSPEVILGAKFDSSVDIWSAACLIFEMLTGDYLFDPHSGVGYDRDEDHLALIIELLGPMPRHLSRRGEFSRELFNRHGQLRHIRKLDYFPLVEVLEEKYKFSKEDSKMVSEFLEPMLALDGSKRATSKECLGHRFFDEERRKDVGHTDSGAGSKDRR
ncbi:unnamed protein product [Chondrus crispus]|uniref:non-specific serine/threonine protein kinase n=1 Tax=Chondrus crispus TaxID=2769 RepID=R7QV64_CHOCR|nr:unnamed protein product [Chondrus crispus]CDF41361.1 unnamed protein product [Chondrus crispus]|eukprot:XP_005711655.1 unnamed protein product [Chondrus crispus]